MTSACFFLRLRVQLGVNMPAQANRKVLQDEANSKEVELFEVYDVVLYLGIIDILQVYNVRKKAEHAYKSLQFDPLTISVVEPKLYSRRFINFLEKVFPEQPWIGIFLIFFCWLSRLYWYLASVITDTNSFAVIDCKMTISHNKCTHLLVVCMNRLLISLVFGYGHWAETVPIEPALHHVEGEIF